MLELIYVYICIIRKYKSKFTFLSWLHYVCIFGIVSTITENRKIKHTYFRVCKRRSTSRARSRVIIHIWFRCVRTGSNAKIKQRISKRASQSVCLRSFTILIMNNSKVHYQYPKYSILYLIIISYNNYIKIK